MFVGGNLEIEPRNLHWLIFQIVSKNQRLIYISVMNLFILYFRKFSQFLQEYVLEQISVLYVAVATLCHVWGWKTEIYVGGTEANPSTKSKHKTLDRKVLTCWRKSMCVCFLPDLEWRDMDADDCEFCCGAGDGGVGISLGTGPESGARLGFYTVSS